jgi:deoxyribodipyrimidine photo-lyase
MRPATVVLFTRDLRVHDQPALRAATDDGGAVAPLFVLDDAFLDGGAGASSPSGAAATVSSTRSSTRSRAHACPRRLRRRRAYALASSPTTILSAAIA